MSVHQDRELQGSSQGEDHHHGEGGPDQGSRHPQPQRSGNNQHCDEGHFESSCPFWQTNASPLPLHFPNRVSENEKVVKNDKQPKFLPGSDLSG